MRRYDIEIFSKLREFKGQVALFSPTQAFYVRDDKVKCKVADGKLRVCILF